MFEPLSQPLFWPPPPEPARIHYVGALMTDRDLKPGKSFGNAMGELLFGRREANRMISPYAVATDDTERVFVCDSNGQIVHVFDLESRRYEQWTPGTNERFAQPVGLAWDPNGRLFVSDPVAGVIFTLDSRGNLTGTLGEGVLERPCGMAFDAVRNRLFVADTGLHQVIVLDGEGGLTAKLGERGAGPGDFNFPTNVALDGQGRLYVSDSLNFRVQVFDTELNFVRRIGRLGDAPGYFSQPKGVALDRRGHLYVVDAHFEAVQIFDPEGRLLLSFGAEGVGPGEFWLPAGIHVDERDRIWVADVYNRRVQVFQYRAPSTEAQP